MFRTWWKKLPRTQPFGRHAYTRMDVKTDSEAAMEGEPAFCNITITRDSTRSAAPRVPVVRNPNHGSSPLSSRFTQIPPQHCAGKPRIDTNPIALRSPPPESALSSLGQVQSVASLGPHFLISQVS
jgi:hypothetical protein